MTDISIMDRPEIAGLIMDPIKQRLLRALQDPASASELARRFDMPRQKLNYHLKHLEHAKLIEISEERRKRNCLELVYRRTADHFILDPLLLGSLATPRVDSQDRFSWTTMLAILVRSLKEIIQLRRLADTNKKKLATFSMDIDISFATPKEMGEFMTKVATTLHTLSQPYHRPDTPKARRYRLLVLSHAHHEEEPGHGPKNHCH